MGTCSLALATPITTATPPNTPPSAWSNAVPTSPNVSFPSPSASNKGTTVPALSTPAGACGNASAAEAPPSFASPLASAALVSLDATDLVGDPSLVPPFVLVDGPFAFFTSFLAPVTAFGDEPLAATPFGLAFEALLSLPNTPPSARSIIVPMSPNESCPSPSASSALTTAPTMSTPAAVSASEAGAGACTSLDEARAGILASAAF